MQSKNDYDECSRCCPECIVARSNHCAHCPAYRQTVAASVEDGYDYSHLIGNPGMRHDNSFDAMQFDQLLTDYDRVLLRFGMRILWQ